MGRGWGGVGAARGKWEGGNLVAESHVVITLQSGANMNVPQNREPKIPTDKMSNKNSTLTKC